MSMGDKGFCVRLLEKEFRVACPKNQENALREAAQYLDRQMRIIRQTGRVIGMERIAIMAALNIANEMLILKNRPLESEVNFSERIKILQEKIDGVLALTHRSPFTLPKESRVEEKKERSTLNTTLAEKIE